MKKKALFVMEKWCDFSPSKSLTNSFHNFVNTFRQARPDYQLNTLHVDECFYVFHCNIDKVLIEYCLNYHTDLIIFSLADTKDCNPSLECCKILKEMGITLCFLWHDSHNPSNVRLREFYYNISDLHIIYDHPYDGKLMDAPPREKEIKLFAPQDLTLYFPDKQVIPVSFIGSLRDPYRRTLVSSLKRQFPEMVVAGGEREDSLSPEEYAVLIRTSKIGINYSFHPFGYWQIKGRAYEVIASKSLLLESASEPLKQIFRPEIDYIEYLDVLDLSEKIKYYLTHEEERVKVATEGYDNYIAHYTGKHFWDKILERLK